MSANNNSEHFRSQVKKASLTSILSSIVSNSKYNHSRDVFEPLDVDAFYEPDEFFGSFTPAMIAITDHLLFRDSAQEAVFPSQASLGLTLGLARETVNRALKQLCSLGIFKKIYRHRHTCLYRIDAYFKDPQVRAKLSKFFPSLKRLPVVNVTPLMNYIYNKYQVATCNMRNTWKSFASQGRNMDEKDIDILTGTTRHQKDPKGGKSNSFFSRSDSDSHEHEQFSRDKVSPTVRITNKTHLNGVNPYQMWKPNQLPPKNQLSALEKYPQFAYKPKPAPPPRPPSEEYKLDESAQNSFLAPYFNLFQTKRLER